MWIMANNSVEATKREMFINFLLNNVAFTVQRFLVCVRWITQRQEAKKRLEQVEKWWWGGNQKAGGQKREMKWDDLIV